MNILETGHLAVGYEKKKVVEDINLQVKKGQLVCLMGPNGSGKSTILKTLSSLLDPLEGSIRMFGEELKDINKKKLAGMLAVVLTERLSVGFLTAFDVAAMGRHPHTGFLGGLRESDRKVVWECLRMVHAEDIAERGFNELSDGERQKVMIARALAQEPQLILLDEPTTHLDIRHKLEVLSILKTLGREKGITVVLSLHEVDMALKSCDIAVMVKNGRIAAAGLPEEVGSDRAVCELFDIRCAGFNAFLGTVELSNTLPPEVFVVGGGGTGAGIYRLLTRSGVGFRTGVLHENDVDCHIVETMGIPAVKEQPFRRIGDTAVREAAELAEKAALVIDSGFPVSEMNGPNLELIAGMLKKGRRVCSLRDESEIRRWYGEEASRILRCGTTEELLKQCQMERQGRSGLE